ncbi:MAG: transposase [Spirochaetes bacterium]|nr:transposase [Spirochaetota bacterium]
MKIRKAIGIDPDSQSLVCVLVDPLITGQIKNRSFSLTNDGLTNFVKWVKKEDDIIIALEGLNGQSRPIEDELRKNKLVFYSFKPSDVKKFRESVLGRNKNNKRDAEAVARYAISLESQNKLENYKRVWFADAALQNLTREYERITKKITEEVSSLWKAIKAMSPDLYLLLGGNHPDSDIKTNILQQKGILTLLTEKIDVSEWKKMSESEILTAMGGKKYKNREKQIAELKKNVSNIHTVFPADMLVAKNTVTRLLLAKTQRYDVKKMINQITANNLYVQTLSKLDGIGTVTASIIVAETIDIRRFINDDRYASYSGFGMNQNSTGPETKSQRLVHTRNFNHRLKNAFMTASKSFVLHSPDSHLAGYFKNLRKRGLSIIEARKRVARALIRKFFKMLKSVNKIDELNIIDIKLISRKGMASGQDRSGNSTISNIPLSACK